MAARTLVDALGERHFLAMPTSAAILARVGRVHHYISSPGACSLIRQTGGEHRPCGGADALGETMVVEHVINGQILNRDSAMLVDDLPALLVREVLAAVGDALMDARHHLPTLAAFRCSALSLLWPRLFGETTLRLRQHRLISTEEARDGCLLCGRGVEAILERRFLHTSM